MAVTGRISESENCIIITAFHNQIMKAEIKSHSASYITACATSNSGKRGKIGVDIIDPGVSHNCDIRMGICGIRNL